MAKHTEQKHIDTKSNAASPVESDARRAPNPNRPERKPGAWVSVTAPERAKRRAWSWQRDGFLVTGLVQRIAQKKTPGYEDPTERVQKTMIEMRLTVDASGNELAAGEVGEEVTLWLPESAFNLLRHLGRGRAVNELRVERTDTPSERDPSRDDTSYDYQWRTL